MKKEGFVVKKVKGFYDVEVNRQVYLCRVKNTLIKQQTSLAVGDRVMIDLVESQKENWIYDVLPRQNELARLIHQNKKRQILVVNIDLLFIVVSQQQPLPRLGLIDRFIAAAESIGIHAVIVLNKIDLEPTPISAYICEQYTALGYSVLQTSVQNNVGIESVRRLLQGKISVMTGHSGVGKSSLIQMLFPEEQIIMGQVSAMTGKGRHTTTLAELYPLPQGGHLADTPGIREWSLTLTPQELAQKGFVEFQPFQSQCRFSPCFHQHEPQCAIKDAVHANQISQQRYNSYLKLLQESDVHKKKGIAN